MKKVLIIGDNGHGMETAGKRTPKFADGNYIHEHEFNQPTCTKFLDKCMHVGFEIADVAPGDCDVPLATRTTRANNLYKAFKEKNPDGVCLFVSFHFNARNGKFDNKIGGIDVHYYPGAEDSKKLAQYIQSELIKGTEMYNRGIKANDFHVLRKTHMTAVLCECGFMDKEIEAKLMTNENYQNEVATHDFDIDKH